LGLASSWPCRSSYPRPRPWTRLHGRSSPGVRPLFTAYPDLPAPLLSVRSSSPGVSLPYSAPGCESSRLAGLPRSSSPDLFSPGFRRRVPFRRLRRPLTGFPNLSAAFVSHDRPAFFRQVALLGFRPTGVCSCRAAPAVRHRRRALVTFLLRGSRSRLQLGHPRAREPVPRMTDAPAFSVFRALIRASIGPIEGHSFHDVSTDHSPRGLPPPHGLTSGPGEAATPRPSRFEDAPSVPGPRAPCVPRPSGSGSDPSLARRANHPKVLRLRPAAPRR
jgi:hypothetical protein